MSLALYRKYRPQNFDEVGGQAHIKKTLENEIKSGRIAHAYLFAGPRGIGKTTVARILAKAVNCLKRKEGHSEPCNSCPICEEFSAGRSLDLIEIDAASHTGVDNVRENIIDNVRFTPQRAKYKVFIIDEVHMLSTSAFNALFKTLEEPPEHVIFILCTTELHKLPETIISRCQRFDFRKPTKEEVIEKIKNICHEEKVNVDEAVLAEIARASEGFFRDAESLLAQVLTLGNKITLKEAELVIPKSNFNLIAELFNYLVEKKTKEALKLLESLVDEGIDLDNFYHQLIEYSREIILNKIYGQTKGQPRIQESAYALELSELVEIVKILLSKEREIKMTDFPILPLELGIIEICDQNESVPAVKNTANEDNTEPIVNEKKANFNKKKEIPLKAVAKKEISDEPAEEKIETKSDSPAKVSISLVKERWQKIVTLSKKFNHALPFILKVAEPMKIEGNKLTLGFVYDFHMDRMRDKKNKNALEDIIKEELGESLSIVISRIERVVVERQEEPTEDAVPAAPPGDGILDNILDIFEGKVVS